ncbi:uncharacterized protein LOC129370983 isoform X2 [Poeciliopsis prolifica]|uniref:uncharacterized protein LOC129370983 isoform X2 n=1 Tax=Poeciliopsis prolifica TaxID=188132 RepID=UPI002413C6EA|nr:uncharacterized protein LOC129370983 isoform X2 [Poeciliopsis prolifica]
MTAYTLQTFFTWTYKGILCTCRFLWICPYNAIKFLPRETHITEEKSRQVTRHVAHESKVTAAIPGSPDRVNALHKRVTKTEREILSIKTRIACERASWEKRFSELQRQQEELRNQVFSEAEILLNVGTCEEQGDNGDDLDEQSKDPKCHQEVAAIHAVYQGARDPCQPHRAQDHLLLYLQPQEVCDPGKRLTAHIGFLSPTHPWTCNWAIGLESCCHLAGSAQEQFVSWGTCRGSQSSTLVWSCRAMTHHCVTAVIMDIPTLNANRDMVPLCHSTSC